MQLFLLRTLLFAFFTLKYMENEAFSLVMTCLSVIFLYNTVSIDTFMYLNEKKISISLQELKTPMSVCCSDV